MVEKPGAPGGKTRPVQPVERPDPVPISNPGAGPAQTPPPEPMCIAPGRTIPCPQVAAPGGQPPPNPAGGAAAPPQITGAQLAARAQASLQLAAPKIGIVPKMGAGRMGYVGVPVWMWTPAQQWKPQTVTATIPGLSVTVIAQLTSIDWAMGDGSTVTCRTPGTPYQVAFGLKKSPDCRYRYEHPSGDQPGQQYTVTATANYKVAWSGAAAGEQQVQVDSTTPLTIGEIQVLITS